MSTPSDTPSSAASPAMSWPRKALLLTGTALGLGIAFDVLFYGKLPGISFPIFIVLLLSAMVGLARYSKVAIRRQTLLLMLPLLFFGAMVAVRGSEFLTFLNVCASLYLLLLLAHSMFGLHVRAYGLRQYVSPVFRLPLRIIERAVATLSEVTVMRQLARKHPAVPQVIRGVAIAVPLLVVFVALFASADLVFRKFVTEALSINVNEQIIFHVFWIATVSFMALGWLAYMVRKPSDVVEQTEPSATTPAKHRLSTIEMAILFVPLNVLFLGFIALQLAYLFGGEQNIAAQGFTYAQYARKGFFELIAVAALSFGLILIVRRFLAERGKQFKIVSGALIVQVLIIMASAFQRLSLYESAYGFTSLRLYSHIFIVWLAVALGLLLYQIVRNKAGATLAFGLFVSALATLTFVNVLSVDVMVARKNIDRYHATGKIDAFYLRELSDDAVPHVATLLDAKDKQVVRLVSAQLYARRIALDEKTGAWQSANLARERALATLQERGEQLKRLNSSETIYLPGTR